MTASLEIIARRAIARFIDRRNALKVAPTTHAHELFHTRRVAARLADAKARIQHEPGMRHLRKFERRYGV